MNNKDRKFGGRLLDIVLITTIFTLFSFITVFVITSKESKFQNVLANDEVIEEQIVEEPEILPSPVIEEFETAFDGVHIIHEKLNDKSTPYHIQSVQTKFEIINNEINQYISTSKEQYENAVRLNNLTNETKNLFNNLKISSEIFEHDNKYISIVFTKSEAIGSNIYESTIKTIFFNNETGEMIDLRHLIDLNVDHLITFTDHVHSSILNNKTYNQYIHNDQFFAATEPKWKLYKRFAIKDDQLIIYFDKGEVAERNAGIPTATISLTSIYSLLAPEFKNGIKDNSTRPNTPSHNGKKVALTFDDGPHPTITMQILNTLDKYDAKATFFVVGNRVDDYSDVLIETVKRGHEIGNHTWNHARLTALSSENVLEQIRLTNEAIKNVTGQYPDVFRPPYGDKNKRVTDLIDLPAVLWTIDSLDWKHRDSSKLLPMIKKNMHNNAIILMHDIHQSTADGLESVLKYLQNEGYEFVTVSELLLQDK